MKISVYPGGRVLVTRPYFISEKKAISFLSLKKEWILKSIEKQKLVSPRKSFTKKDYFKNKDLAREEVLKRLEHFNQFYRFKYKKIYIRNQKTRWGSCSSMGNLSFNWKIIKLSEKLKSYIIVHELCHLKELNHSKRFWELVSRTIPDYKETRRLVQNHIF